MTSPATDFRISPAESAWRESARRLAPPPNLPLSEWLDRYFVLAPESSSSQAGPWRTLPYQRAIADALTDPEIETITVRKSSRVGFTKLVVGYFCYRICVDPCSIMAVQPSLGDLRKFSRKEIAPAFAAACQGLVSEPRARSGANTIEEKDFPGGSLRIVGAHSGLGFRGSTVDVVAWDEIDGYPASSGGEGDAIALGRRRAETADFPKFILGSSPKLKGTSRIDASFEESDQRSYHVPCPHCDHGQPLRWGGKGADYGIKFPNGPNSAYYLCENCRQRIDEIRKPWMVEQGRWIAARPDVVGHAGFELWAGYSPFPRVTWPALVSEFLDANTPERLQVFVNTVLGESFEMKGKGPKESQILSRRETYPLRETGRLIDGHPERVEMVPRDAVVLTSFTDVQFNRVETGVEGHGAGEENWKLEYHVLYGDPTASALWMELFDLLRRPRYLERGGVDYIRASGVDSGYAAQSVYAFVAERSVYDTDDGQFAYLWATKGVSRAGPVWPKAPTLDNKGKIPLYTINVDAAKDHVYAQAEKPPGPGYMHVGSGFDESWARSFSAEHAHEKRDKKGFPIRVYEMRPGHRRNEALDIAAGNYAMLCGLYAIGFDLEAAAREIGESAGAEPEPTPGGPPPPAQPAAPLRAESWMSTQMGNRLGGPRRRRWMDR